MSRYTSFRNDDLQAVDASIKPFSPVQKCTSNIEVSTPIELFDAQASQKIKITYIAITNGHESQDIWVEIYDESDAANPIFAAFVAAGGGISASFGTNPLSQNTIGKKMYIISDAAADYRAVVVGYRE
jgi:hypothetical protein